MQINAWNLAIKEIETDAAADLTQVERAVNLQALPSDPSRMERIGNIRIRGKPAHNLRPYKGSSSEVRAIDFTENCGAHESPLGPVQWHSLERGACQSQHTRRSLSRA